MLLCVGHWFLTQHVRTGASGALGMLPMKHVRRSNIDGIDAFVFERTLEIVVVISLCMIAFR